MQHDLTLTTATAATHPHSPLQYYFNQNAFAAATSAPTTTTPTTTTTATATAAFTTATSSSPHTTFTMDKRLSLDFTASSLLSLPLQSRLTPSSATSPEHGGHQRAHSFSASPSPSLSAPSSPSRSPSPSSPTGVGKNGNSPTFVHKLHTMVTDKKHQHLISWNFSGTSFVVNNITEFARSVLPEHFKHSNFSSFVRQLNMYGFHKVNKSPRGHRTAAETQVWEFSHPKFVRNRPDLLDDIKRKSMESESLRRETGDLQSQIAMMQVTQSDMIQQISHLQENFTEVVRELAETKRRHNIQQQLLKSVIEYLQSQNAPFFPSGLDLDKMETKAEPERPSIYITNADATAHSNFFGQAAAAAAAAAAANANVNPNNNVNVNVNATSPNHEARVLTVQTTHLNPTSPTNLSAASPTGYREASPTMMTHQQQLQAQSYLNAQAQANAAAAMHASLASGQLAAYNQAMGTPLPPSPVPSSPMGAPISDDDSRRTGMLYPASASPAAGVHPDMASPFYQM